MLVAMKRTSAAAGGQRDSPMADWLGGVTRGSSHMARRMLGTVEADRSHRCCFYRARFGEEFKQRAPPFSGSAASSSSGR
jgi:hypothetical protein